MSNPLNISPEDLKDRTARVDKTPAQLTREQIERRRRSFWKDRPLGRTLSLRNKTGKTIAAVGSAAAGMATGVNIEPILSAATEPILTTGGANIMDFNLFELISMLVTAIIGFLTARELVKGVLREILEEVEDIVDASAKAKQADSPGGEETTPEEEKLIRKEVDDLIMVLYKRLLRNRIFRLFGIDKRPSNE